MAPVGDKHTHQPPGLRPDPPDGQPAQVPLGHRHTPAARSQARSVRSRHDGRGGVDRRDTSAGALSAHGGRACLPAIAEGFSTQPPDLAEAGSAGTRASGDSVGVNGSACPPTGADISAENAAWVDGLSSPGPDYEPTVARLYRILVKFAYLEARRRAARLRLSGPELEDIAHQAAADATLTICGKVTTFRGECRFTTWAYRFVAFDVTAKITRHFWQRLPAHIDDEDWTLLPASPFHGPEDQVENRDLRRAVENACNDVLTDKQRRVFEAVAVRGTPTSQVAHALGATPNAIYKTMFDARRKLRAALSAAGYFAD